MIYFRADTGQLVDIPGPRLRDDELAAVLSWRDEGQNDEHVASIFTGRDEINPDLWLLTGPPTETTATRTIDTTPRQPRRNEDAERIGLLRSIAEQQLPDTKPPLTTNTTPPLTVKRETIAVPPKSTPTVENTPIAVPPKPTPTLKNKTIALLPKPTPRLNKKRIAVQPKRQPPPTVTINTDKDETGKGTNDRGTKRLHDQSVDTNDMLDDIQTETSRPKRHKAEARVNERDVTMIRRSTRESSHTTQVADTTDKGYRNVMYWSLTEEDKDFNEFTDTNALLERSAKQTVSKSSTPFPPLTVAAVQRLRQYMTAVSDNKRVLNIVDDYTLDITTIKRLKPNVWLDDNVINIYVNLLNRRSSNTTRVHIWTTFFFARLAGPAVSLDKYDFPLVQRWSTALDVFRCRMILFPINKCQQHWSLGVVDLVLKQVRHYDSAYESDPTVLQILFKWVSDEAQARNVSTTVFNRKEWKKVPVRGIPKQRNGEDCGVFMCKYADYLSSGATTFNFCQDDMLYFRARMAHELVMGKIQ